MMTPSPQEKQIPEFEQILQMLYSQQQQQATTPYSLCLQKIKRWMIPILGILVVSGKSLHGTAHVTSELKKSAKTTAGMATGSNILDAIFNLSLFYFLFLGSSLILTLTLSILASLIMLRISNILSTGVAQYAPGRKLGSVAKI